MSKRIFFFSFFSCLFFSLFADNTFTVSGFVKDKQSGEVLYSVDIVNADNENEGTQSNQYGFFSLTSASEIRGLVVSFGGYETQQVSVTDKTIVILLSSENIRTDSVVITDKVADHNLVKQSGKMTMDIATIKKLPVLLGETDVLKTISLLPGVKQGAEGSTGFYVRGGGVDQNLILLDEAIVYNPSHLASFFSIFNGDALKNVEVIKGGMPANYGGRLASVINVTTKDGNDQKFQGTGGIGLLTSRISLEGPIKKDKGSFIISGRRTFIDLLTVPFFPKSFKGNTYYFYDLNLKANYRLGDKDRIYLSAYTGQDVFKFNLPTGQGVKVNINYGNQIAALRWNHLFNNRLFCNTTLSYNRYHITYDSYLGQNSLYIPSKLSDVSLKHDYSYFASPRYTLKFGGQYQFHSFMFGNSESNQSGVIVKAQIPSKYAHEGAFYFSSEYNITDRIQLNAGLRYSLFDLIGPYTETSFDSTGNPIGTGKSYKKGESVQFYNGFEPRIAGRVLVGHDGSLKGSYTRTYQYVQLATASSGLLPTDVWLPASQTVKPQIADQFTLGYFRNFAQNKYEAYMDFYYKSMQNQIEFQQGMPLVFTENLERFMNFGKGLSYGVEFFVKRNIGKTTGWIGYTLSKTTRTFPNLNGGKPFPARSDRRHDLQIAINHAFNAKWTGSLVWVMSSGSPITLPSARYTTFLGYNDPQNPTYNTSSVYTSVNTYRMPLYHRADVSFTYTPIPKKIRKIKGSWTFAAYNAYSRLNPYFVYWEVDKKTQKPVTKAITVFPIVPSVTWNFKF